MTNDPLCLPYLKLNLEGSAGDEHRPYEKKIAEPVNPGKRSRVEQEQRRPSALYLS
jgi:hypothetical protein